MKLFSNSLYCIFLDSNDNLFEKLIPFILRDFY